MSIGQVLRFKEIAKDTKVAKHILELIILKRISTWTNLGLKIFY